MWEDWEFKASLDHLVLSYLKSKRRKQRTNAVSAMYGKLQTARCHGQILLPLK